MVHRLSTFKYDQKNRIPSTFKYDQKNRLSALKYDQKNRATTTFNQDPKVAENTGYSVRKYNIQQQFHTSPFDNSGYGVADLKRQNMLLTQIFSAQESYIQDLRLEIDSLRSEVASLKNSMQKNKMLMELKINSENNAELLKTLFALKQPLTADPNPLNTLKGLIKDFSDEKTDSVELIRQIRGK